MTKEYECEDVMVDDERLAEAQRVAMETGNLTPLVKEELKYTIMSRREADGKGQLEVTFDDPQQYQLTPEEVQRVERRRQQNRNAARRFRQKQKQSSHEFIKKIQFLESDNTTLRSQLDKLKREKDELQKEFHAHLLICPTLGLNGTSWDGRHRLEQ
ncbi:basic leucine zipper transcriptional factor ATF-like 3 [Argopecten irradians]|uniref:basic leucine zipper transcriptional factor ATF-like 3 n=1 Tax=Argopecten irradians TaxID=31199 RepID=UPI003721F58E